MKRIAMVLVALCVALVGAVVLLNRGGEDVAGEPAASGPPDAARAQRGAYLARAGNCMTCHTDRGGAPYAGGRPIETPFGTVYASNLTPDPDTGLGLWSAGQFRRALQHGKSRDGRLLYPAFPYNYYTQVSRADADDLFEYLRSLPPVRQPNRDHQLRWPFNTQAALAAWRALYFRAGEHADDPQQAAAWNRGAYLVRGLGHCGACHSARNALGASSDLMDLSGGLIPMQNWYAPSLTSAAEAGVGDWTPAEVAQLMKTGAAPRATVLGPMAEVVLHSTQYLDAADLDAMAVFLKSLQAPSPPVATETRLAPKALMERGGRIYADRCAQCHGERGEGVAGAYPALAGNRAVLLPVTANLVQVVLFGGFAPATQGNPRPFGMPPYATLMTDSDVAAVLTYIRGSWGNQAAPVSELSVSTQRDMTR